MDTINRKAKYKTKHEISYYVESRYGPNYEWKCEFQVTESLQQAKKDKEYYLFTTKRISESNSFISKYLIKPEARVIKRTIRMIKKIKTEIMET